MKQRRVDIPIFSMLMLALVAPAMAQPNRQAPALPPVAAQPNVARGDEFTPALQQAVTKALDRLASLQLRDGTFGKPSDDTLGANSAITALAGIAFMQSGSFPGRGKYADNVQRAMDHVLSACQDSGLVSSDQGTKPMYGHGFATLFLGEIYGMTGNEQIKEKLQRAVRIIEKSQNAQGGWRYQPAPVDADISVTICQIMALRAARDAGVKVEKQVIDNAIKYVRDCQNGDGGFSYMPGGFGPGGGGSAFPRSAAGVASLYYAGVFEGEEITRGLEYVRRFKPGAGMLNFGGGRVMGGGQHYFYGHYYAVQCMFLAGGSYWAEWYPAIRDDLLASQDRNGGWDNEISESYSTAMALIILQMPNRYLPVYTGKGPGS